MNLKSLKTLEYNKIIEKLEAFATSEAAKNKVLALTPMTDINAINTALTETNDALSRVYAKGTIPFSGVTDITDSLKRLEVGSSLGIVELLHISALLTVTDFVYQIFFRVEKKFFAIEIYKL